MKEENEVLTVELSVVTQSSNLTVCRGGWVEKHIRYDFLGTNTYTYKHAHMKHVIILL